MGNLELRLHEHDENGTLLAASRRRAGDLAPRIVSENTKLLWLLAAADGTPDLTSRVQRGDLIAPLGYTAIAESSSRGTLIEGAVL
jgi:hypothetical protein